MLISCLTLQRGNRTMYLYSCKNFFFAFTYGSEVKDHFDYLQFHFNSGKPWESEDTLFEAKHGAI